MADSGTSSEASDIANFIADFGCSSDDGELDAVPDSSLVQPKHAASELAHRVTEPEPEHEPATTPHGVAAELVNALSRRCGAASWLDACATLAALGGPADAVVVQFKRQGGMRLLTSLLQTAASEPIDRAEVLLDAATTAIASCSGATARPQQRVFEIADGMSIRVQELPYETAGTGHAVWSAAILQARWLCMNRTQLQQQEIRDVLELGSGLGLSGLTLAKLGLPGLTVTLTDIVPSIVRNLLLSASLNRITTGEPLNVRACLCDWGVESNLGEAHSAHGWPGVEMNSSTDESNGGKAASPKEVPGAIDMLPQGETFDLVLAADVLYEPDHPALLAGVLKRRLRAGGRFYAVCSIRQLTLLEDLLTRLEELCEEVAVTPEDTEGLEHATCPGLGSWTTQHASSYVGGIQRISGKLRTPVACDEQDE